MLNALKLWLNSYAAFLIAGLIVGFTMTLGACDNATKTSGAIGSNSWTAVCNRATGQSGSSNSSTNNQSGPTPTPGQVALTTVPATVSTTSGTVINMKVELACTGEQQGTGLMGRTSLPADSGMLFIFQEKVRIGFWMKDTLIPLSIAWIDEKGTILEIQDMEAKSEATHYPQQEYVWALEVPKGYFAQKGIKEGSIFKVS